MRDWWKALLILVPLALAAVLLWTLVYGTVVDPIGSMLRRLQIIVDSWPVTALPVSWEWWVTLSVLLCMPLISRLDSRMPGGSSVEP